MLCISHLASPPCWGRGVRSYNPVRWITASSSGSSRILIIGLWHMRDPGLPSILGTADDQGEWSRRHRAKKEWDRQHTYVIDMIKVLLGRKYGMRNVDFHAAVWAKRHASGEPMPKKFGATIESVLNQYSSQRAVFRMKGRTAEDDLFFSPARGKWMLYSDDRARQWFRRKTGEDL